MTQEKNKIYQLYMTNKSTILTTKLETLQSFIYATWGAAKAININTFLKKYVLKTHLQNILGRYQKLLNF